MTDRIPLPYNHCERHKALTGEGEKLASSLFPPNASNLTHAHTCPPKLGGSCWEIIVDTRDMSSKSSSQDIASRVGLDTKELDKPCEESLLPSLANFVHPWRLVFSCLLDQIDLDDVESENSGRSEQEKRLACLRKWKLRCGARATCGVIVNALLENGYVENAESMCRHLQEITGIKQEGRHAKATYNLFVPSVIRFVTHPQKPLLNL